MTSSLLAFLITAAVATLLIAMSLCLPMLDGRATEPAKRRSARWVTIAWALALPVLATSMYALLGAPRSLLVEPQSPAHRMNTSDMAQATERLAQKLKTSPDDLEAWFTLARSYQAMERWQQAVDAYRQALRLAPDDPQLMSDLADALASSQGGKLEGEPMMWVSRALSHDPLHVKSRALAAMAAYRSGHLDEAHEHWEKLAALSPPGSQGAELARQGIARIKDGRPATPAAR